jgi:hypothetical protein
VSDHFDVAFENCVVRTIEANDCGEKPYVGFRDGVAKQVRGVFRLSQKCFHSVQAVEEFPDVLIVHLLRSGKADPVHAVVDSVEQPIVQFVNVLDQMWWAKTAALLAGLAIFHR